MNSSARRTLALTVAAATATAGTLVWAPAAQAKGTITDYGLSGRAYGTQVKGNTLGASSSRSAEAHVACTRRTGVKRHNDAVDIGDGIDGIRVKTIDNRTRTYRTRKKFGTRSVATIERVELGNDEARIVLTGLRTTADAFTNRRTGKLGTKSRFTSVDIQAEGTPIDEQLNQVGAGVGDLLDAIKEQSGGELSLGPVTLKVQSSNNKVKPRKAIAQGSALRVVADGGATVVIGKARATIHKDVTSGVFRGKAVPLESELLGGVVGIGRVIDKPLPCPGTNGKVQRMATVDVDALGLGLATVSGVDGRAYGLQGRRGSAKGWTESSVATVALGTGEQRVVVRGIVGRALVKMNRSGKIVEKSAAGSTIGSLRIGGERQALPDPGQAIFTPGGLAELKFFVKKRSKRGLAVTALRLKLLKGTDAGSVVNLGAAKTYITRS